jgi:hypothetical protein
MCMIYVKVLLNPLLHIVKRNVLDPAPASDYLNIHNENKSILFEKNAYI